MPPLLTFFIILSILVLVHELGHFLAARRFKIKVEEFGFGYPPKILGFKKQETEYSLNLLPFGGFVRLLGEDMPEGKASFANQKKRVKAVVLLAGVGMNFLLGILLFAGIYTKIGIPEKVDYLRVTGVTDGSPAQAAGLRSGDKIIGFTDTQAFISWVNENRGQEVVVRLDAGREVKLTPRLAEETPAGQGALGVGITDVDLVLYPVWQRPFRGMVTGVKEAWLWGEEIVIGLGKMVIGLIKGEAPKDVTGPVGIYEISKNVAKEGIMATLQFMAILSINLAILNLLPLPALDGGRLFFVVGEIITGRKLKPEWEQRIHLAGMLALIGLMILITIKDIQRLTG